MTSFRCGPSDSQPNLWCYNQGNCSAQFSSPSCACPSNVGQDFYIFHDPNCTNPSPQFTYMAIFIGSLLLAVPVACFVSYYRPRRTDLKHMQRWSLAGLACMQAMNLAIYLQNGTFEGASLFWSLGLTCDCIACFMLVSSVLKPVIPLKWADASLPIRLYMWLTAGIWLACAISMIALCRNTDGANFNSAVCVIFLLLDGANTVNSLIYLRHAEALLLQIDLNTHFARAEKLLERIKQMKKGLRTGMFVGFALNIPLPLQHWIQGSVPYSWLILSVMFNGIYVVIHLGVGLFLRWDSMQHSVVSVTDLTTSKV